MVQQMTIQGIQTSRRVMPLPMREGKPPFCSGHLKPRQNMTHPPKSAHTDFDVVASSASNLIAHPFDKGNPMLLGEDILTASHATRLLYLLATCGAAALGSWLHQSLFALTVTREEIVWSVVSALAFYLFVVGLFLWHIGTALIGGTLWGFAVTGKIAWLDENDRDWD